MGLFGNKQDDAQARAQQMIDAGLIGGGPAPGAAPAKPKAPRFSIGKFEIPHKFEHRGFLLSGAPGTGKSVLITTMLDVLVPRGDSGFIADRSGIYLSRYYNASRDIVLNPLDARAVDWSPLAEFEREDNYTAQTIAQSIIPEGSGEAQQWNTGAQTLLTAILEHCYDNSLTNAEILRLALRAPVEELREVFEGKAAEAQVAEGNERMFGSLRAIVAAYIQPFQRLAPGAGRTSFSIKDHVRSGHQGWLFFNYTTPQMLPLRRVICTVSDIWCEAVMSLPPDETRRQWLILDEFSSLGRINGIANFVANARKHGGCSVLGVQSVYQGFDEYTENTFLGMLSSLNSQVILRTADGKTAEYLSKNLGNERKQRWVRNFSASNSASHSGDSSSESSSRSEQHVIEQKFLEGELLTLPDRVAVLKLPGDLPADMVGLELPAQREPVAAPFEPRPQAAKLPAGDAAAAFAAVKREHTPAASRQTEPVREVAGLDDLQNV